MVPTNFENREVMSIEKRFEEIEIPTEHQRGREDTWISFRIQESYGSWNAHRIRMEGRESVMGRRLKFRSTSDNREELIINDSDGAQLT